MSLRPKALLVALALGSLSLLTPSLAHATTNTDTPTQERIDEVIAEYGGEQTAWNEVTWNDGEVVFTTAPSTASRQVTAAAARNCNSGSHCVFSGTGYTGERLTFSSCSSNQSVSGLSSVRSVANNRSGKSVKVYKNSTLLTTVSANSGKNVSSGATSLTCS